MVLGQLRSVIGRGARLCPSMDLRTSCQDSGMGTADGVGTVLSEAREWGLGDVQRAESTHSA